MVKKEETIEKEIITRKIIRAKPTNKKKTTSTKKKIVPKKRTTRKKKTTPKKSPKEIEIEKVLIDNFTSIQKVMVNLSEKFNILSHKIDGLLHLFEESAKELVKKDFVWDKEREMSMNVLSKIDELLEQNKIIAKSMTIFYEAPKETNIEKEIIQQKEELVAPTPPPVQNIQEGYSTSPKIADNEIKSFNKRQEELGMKNPFVKEEEDNLEVPEFEMPK